MWRRMVGGNPLAANPLPDAPNRRNAREMDTNPIARREGNDGLVTKTKECRGSASALLRRLGHGLGSVPDRRVVHLVIREQPVRMTNPLRGGVGAVTIDGHVRRACDRTGCRTRRGS